MDINELKRNWEDYSESINNHTQINKLILKELIIDKSTRRLNWMKLKSIIQMPLSLIILPLFINAVKFRSPGVLLYIGIILYSSLLFLSYWQVYRNYLSVKKIDPIKPFLLNKEYIVNLQIKNAQVRNYNYAIFALSILSMYLLLPFTFSMEYIYQVLAFSLLYFVATIIKWKISVKEIDKLKRELMYINELK